MKKGTLYIIATPIGNLSDMTLRAINTLKEKTDIAYCEDTRVTRKLLLNYNIDLPLQSLHAHSSRKKIETAVSHLLEGKSLSYMTDSGTPGISDPGSELVERARSHGIRVEPIPGPSALASIISVCGFPGKNIIFAGFLSKKEGRRKKELNNLKDFPGIIVIYESPYRIKKLLNSINEIFPECRIIIGREITKIHEEFIAGSLPQIVQKIDTIKEKGEFTIAIMNRR